MYQFTMEYQNNELFRQAVEDMLKGILHNPALDAMLQARQNEWNKRHPETPDNGPINDEKRIKTLEKIIENQEKELEQNTEEKLWAMFHAAEALYSIANDSMAPNASSEGLESRWRTAVENINILSGYTAVDANTVKIELEKDPKDRTEQDNIVKGNDVLQTLRMDFHNYGYNKMQDGMLDQQLLLTYAEIGSGMMEKLANLQRAYDIQKFADRQFRQTEDTRNQEQEFFESIEGMDGIVDIVCNEQTFNNEINRLNNERNNINALLNQKDEVIEAALKNELKEELEQYKKDAYDKMVADATPNYAKDIEVSMQATRRRLEEENEEREEENQEIDQANADSIAFNEDLEKQIEVLENTRKNDIAAVKLRNGDNLRREMEKDYSAKQSKLLTNGPKLEEQEKELNSEIQRLAEAKGIHDYFQDPANMPSPEELAQIETARQSYWTANQLVENIFVAYDKDNNNHELDIFLLNGKDQRLETLREELLDLEEKYNTAKKKLDDFKQENPRSKLRVGKYEKACEEIKGKWEDALREAQDMGRTRDVYEELARYWKDHSEEKELFEKFKKEAIARKPQRDALKADSQKLLNSKKPEDQKRGQELKAQYEKIRDYPAHMSTLDLLEQVSLHYKAQYDALHNTHKVFFDHLEQRDKFGDLLAQPKELAATLAEKRETLERVSKEHKELTDAVPPEREFKKQVEEKTAGMLSDQEVESEIEKINKATDDKIRGLREQKKPITEHVPLHTKEEIDKAVADTKQEKLQLQANQLKEMSFGVAERAEKAFLQEKREAQKTTWRNTFQKLDGRIASLRDIKQKARKLFDKAVDRNKIIDELQSGWQNIRDGQSDMIDFMKEHVEQLHKNIEWGTKEGHSNSPEFKAMMGKVKALHDYLKKSDNVVELKKCNEASINEFKTCLQEAGESARHYLAEKKKGIHWISSDMRFIRLRYAEGLQNFAEQTRNNLTNMQKTETTELSKVQTKVEQATQNQPAREEHLSDLRECRTTRAAKYAKPVKAPKRKGGMELEKPEETRKRSSSLHQPAIKRDGPHK